jgi:putative cell wall-binding protein
MIKRAVSIFSGLLLFVAFVVAPSASSSAAPVPSAPSWGTGTGSISGTATAQNGGAILAGATVSLSGSTSSYYSYSTSTTTDSSGNYTFTGLIPATYKLRIVPPTNSGLAAEWWPAQASMANAQEIIVADGEVSTGKNFALLAESKITGRVTATSGGAVIAGVTVTARVVTDYSSSFQATTDSSGNYEITNLPSGSYELNYRAAGQNFVEQWSGGASRRWDAVAIPVPGQQTISNVNASMASGARVAGNITSEATNTAMSSVTVEVRTADYQYSYSATTDSSGNYEVQGIRAGTYLVSFRPQWGSDYVSEFWNNAAYQDDATTITLSGGQSLSGTNAALTLGGVIQGKVVTSESATTNLQSVQVTAIDPVTNQSVGYATTAADGTYSMRAVRPGTYTLLFDGFYLTPARQRLVLGNVTGYPGGTSFTIHSGETLANKNAVLPITANSYKAPAPIPTITNPSGIREIVTWTQPSSAEPILGYETGGMSNTVGGGGGGGGLIYGLDPNLDLGEGSYFNSRSNSELKYLRAVTSSSRGKLGVAILDSPASGSLEPKPVITVTSTTSTSITIEWTPGSSAPMLNWTVAMYGISNDGDTGNPYSNSGPLTKTFSGLTPGRAYEVFVAGYSSAVATSWGRSGVIWTTGSALSSTPTPTISGGTVVGNTLTATSGSWDNGVDLAYQWQRNGNNISGATSATYVTQNADLGTTIRVQVTGTKDDYSPSSVTSSATGTITASVSSPSPSPSSTSTPTASPSSSPTSGTSPSPSSSSQRRPSPSFNLQRLSGGDRYSTSVQIARPFTAGVPVVYVATGENYPDALSAGSAAAAADGPLLLVDPNYVPGTIRSEIQRLQPQLIVVVGGTGAVSADVYNQLSQLAPSIRRDSGSDRFATSRLIAERAFSSTGATTAFIATGHDFPDALAASAAAASLSAPVILVDGKASSADGGSVYLMHRLGVSRIYIAGGTAVVSAGIEASLKSEFGANNVIRLAGSDRYSTSRTINATIFNSASKTFLAVGTNFPDSLSGAALAGVMGSPLYIVPQNCVPSDVSYDIRRFNSTPVLLGGSGVLGDGVGRLDPC